MVAAVAMLLVLPPKCTVDDKKPDAHEIARFIVRYGHSGDAAFKADVKAKMIRNDENAKEWSDETKALICGYGVIVTAKVREANR